MPPSRRTAYSVINGSSLPVWLAMILAPRSRVTRRLVGFVQPLQIALGLSYDALLTAGVVGRRELLDFRDPDAVRAALGNQDVFLAGWAHYIAFDVFVGRWIWEDALTAGRDRGWRTRLALLLTWMAGPAGLSMYLLGRGRS